ncbi:MAG: hypothetical protein C0597_12600 [Marinilabiliales bacterium]|nr:MAG: hypothetical protein C0597_12600 [Marinilabiliales bacterium]
MKKLQIQTIIDIIILAWLAIWLYYALSNWDVFIVKLNTNLGFKTISLYPFIFFFFLGLIALVIIKYSFNYAHVIMKAKEKENKDKMSLLQKDIEILKLKEVLFKMQTEGMNKSTSTINALNARLDELANKVASEKKQLDVDEESEKE